MDRLQDVERLEARDHDRLAVVGGDELERPAPTTVETWPGPMKPSRRRSGESSSARSGGTIVTWLHMTEKFAMPSAFARMSVSAVDGAVVSKPIAKKTTSRSGFALRDPQRVERRVDHPHVGARGLGVEQRAVASRARASCRRSR